MTGFTFKLEQPDGTPADPPSYSTAVPSWQPGDEIPVRPGRTLRVVMTRLDEGRTATRFPCSSS